MKKSFLYTAAAMALVTASLPAHADGWYARADLSLIADGTADHDTLVANVPGALAVNSESQDMWGGDIGLGYEFGDGFRIEGVLGYRSGDLDVSSAVVPGLVTAPPAVSAPDGDLDSWEAMLNVLYDFNEGGRLRPYVGVGMGAADVDAKAHNLVNSTTGTPVNGFSDSDTGFAYQGLIGLGYKLSDRTTLDVGYRHFGAMGLEFEGPGEYDTTYTDNSIMVGCVGLRGFERH